MTRISSLTQMDYFTFLMDSLNFTVAKASLLNNAVIPEIADEIANGVFRGQILKIYRYVAFCIIEMQNCKLN